MVLDKINILSRKSDLAVIQAREFGQIFSSKFPSIKLNYITKSTSGDKDLKTPLSEMPTEGVFTDDLRDELIKKNCDIIIHSWKDLPLDVCNHTEVAITLDRADESDLLFIKKDNIIWIPLYQDDMDDKDIDIIKKNISYKSISKQDKQRVDETIMHIIKNKYTFISYNGLTQKLVTDLNKKTFNNFIFYFQ